MSMGTTTMFLLPQGWTLRKVAIALAREWLPPFRAVPVVKAAPWMVQPVVEEPGGHDGPLWEPGISTEDYEERLNRNDLCWQIRAKAGRSKGTVLARLAMSKDHPMTFQMECCQDTFPETLFDAEKLGQFLAESGENRSAGLIAALLSDNGFSLASA
jgi:hypothetical protein